MRNGGKAGGDMWAVGRTHHDDSNRSKNRRSPTRTLLPIKFRVGKCYMLLILSKEGVFGKFNLTVNSRQKHKREATNLEG